MPNQTGWLLTVPLAIGDGTKWAHEPKPLSSEVAMDLQAMGIDAGVVLSEPDGKRGALLLDLSPRQVGREADQDRLSKILSMALALMSSDGLLPGGTWIAGEVKAEWHYDPSQA